MTIDRYRKFTDGLVEAITPFLGRHDAVELDTAVYQYLRANAREAVLRGRCDREGHDVTTLHRMKNVHDQMVFVRYACSYCGTALVEVEDE